MENGLLHNLLFILKFLSPFYSNCLCLINPSKYNISITNNPLEFELNPHTTIYKYALAINRSSKKLPT